MAVWRRIPLALPLLAVCSLLPEPARADTSVWLGGTSGSWELPSNWTAGVPEGPGATAGLAGDSFVAVSGTHTLDGIEILDSNRLIVLSGTDAAFSIGQIYLGGSNNTVRVQPDLVSDDVIAIGNISNGSLLAIDRISTTSHLLISASGASGAGTSVTIGHADALGINVDGNAEVSVGLGAGIANITIQPNVERFRITSVDSGFHGTVLSYGGLVDVATDYSVVTSQTLIQGGSLEISGGGKILNRFDRTTIGDTQNLTLSGGELVRGNGVGLTLQSLIVGAQGASKLTFEDGSSSTLSAVDLQVEDRTGTLLIRGAGLGTTNKITLGTTPTLIGSGSAGTAQVGILGQIVVDSNAAGGGTGFATYSGSTGIRALTATEYSSTLQANANVRLTTNSGIGSPTTINSLIMDGGRVLSGAPISIASGMLLSTGGTNTAIAALSSSVGYLNLITASDLVLRGAINPNNTLVKSGTGALHYEAPSAFGSLVVNEGTFRVITGPNNNGDVTVNSGGRLFTHGSQRIASSSEVEINAGGTWELDNGSLQLLNQAISGAGTVKGSGVGVNSFRFSSNSGTVEDLDTRFTGNLSVEITSGQYRLNSTANDYTGTTKIGSSGKLLVGVDNALSANSVVELQAGGTLSLQGRSATVAGLTTFPVGGSIDGGQNGAVSRLEVRVAAGQDYGFSGELSNALLIEKTGEGAQGFGGTFGDDVAFNVREGTLTLSGGFSSSAPAISVRSQGSLVLDVYTSTTAPQVLMEAGGTVTRVGVSSFFNPGTPITAQCLDGRATEASLLSIQGVATITSQFGLFEEGETVSDIFSLDGLDGTTFVLQLTFDPDEWTGDPSLLTLGWWEGSEWIPAYVGNSIDQHEFLGFRSWDSDPTLTLGDWGIDLDSHAVWMVLDHNSDFAIIAVPEPSAALLFAGSGAFFLLRRRRGVC